MLTYGIELAQGSEITNTNIDYGTEFPEAGTESIGQLFFRTDHNVVYVRNGDNTQWTRTDQDQNAVSSFIDNGDGTYYHNDGSNTQTLTHLSFNANDLPFEDNSGSPALVASNVRDAILEVQSNSGGNLSDLETEVDANASEIIRVEGKVDTNAGNISTNASDITTINTRIDDLDGEDISFNDASSPGLVSDNVHDAILEVQSNSELPVNSVPLVVENGGWEELKTYEKLPADVYVLHGTSLGTAVPSSLTAGQVAMDDRTLATTGTFALHEQDKDGNYYNGDPGYVMDYMVAGDKIKIYANDSDYITLKITEGYNWDNTFRFFYFTNCILIENVGGATFADGVEYQFNIFTAGVGDLQVVAGEMNKNWIHLNGGDNLAIAPVAANGALAIGNNAQADMNDSISIGTDSHADGLRSVAFGLGAFADAHNTIAIGEAPQAIGSYSIAIGQNATTAGAGEIAISGGDGTNATSDATDNKIVILTDDAGVRVHNDGTLETTPDGGTNWSGVGASLLNDLSDVTADPLSTSPASDRQAIVFNPTGSPADQWISDSINPLIPTDGKPYVGLDQNWSEIDYSYFEEIPITEISEVGRWEGGNQTTLPGAGAPFLFDWNGDRRNGWGTQFQIATVDRDGTDHSAFLDSLNGLDVTFQAILNPTGDYTTMAAATVSDPGGGVRQFDGNIIDSVIGPNSPTPDYGFAPVDWRIVASAQVGTEKKIYPNKWMQGNNNNEFTTRASATGNNSLAIGNESEASATESIAISGSAIGSYSIAIGQNATTAGAGEIAISGGDGTNATSDATDNKIIILTDDAGIRVQDDGTLETTADGGTGWSAVGGGNNWIYSNQGNDFSIQPAATGTNSLSIGKDALAKEKEDIAIGNEAQTGAAAGFGTAIAIGSRATTVGYGTVCIGQDAQVTANSGTAIGATSEASNQAVAIGVGCKATENDSIAIGRTAQTNATDTKIILLTTDAGLRVSYAGAISTTSDGGSNWSVNAAVYGASSGPSAQTAAIAHIAPDSIDGDRVKLLDIIEHLAEHSKVQLERIEALEARIQHLENA
jgi:hypothetical protein